MQIIVIEKKKKRLIQEIRLTLDALPVLARNDPVTEAVSLWAKILYFVQILVSYSHLSNKRGVHAYQHCNPLQGHYRVELLTGRSL